MVAINSIGRDTTSTAAGNYKNTSMQNWNIATQSLCIVGMAVFFALRIYTRVFILHGFTKEDWACFGAWFLGTCYSAVALIMGHFGGGLHQEGVSAADLVTFSKTVYVTMVMYGPTAFLTKLSLLWIMTRVFRPYKKSVAFMKIFIALMLAYYIPAVIIKVCICRPISRFWIPGSEGKCLNQTAIILADSIISCVSDLIVLILPLPLTLSLQLPMKKKVRVMGVLGAGGLAVASSIVRLALIIRTSHSADRTYAFMRVNMFGTSEIAIGVICACLPSLSALLSRVYHEYSSNKATNTSNFELSDVKPQSRVRQRISMRENPSEQDILIDDAQAEPKIETTVHSDAQCQHSTNQMGIMRTVDVQTFVTRRDS